MATAHLPNSGLSSPAAMEVYYPKPSFPRAALRRRIATPSERVSILRDPFDCWNSVFKCGSVVALLLSMTVFGEAQTSQTEAAFRAAGVISISREDYKSSNKAFGFQIHVKGNRWLIRTDPVDFQTNKSSAAMEYYEAGTNETNIYSGALHNKGLDLQRNHEEGLAFLRKKEQALTIGGMSNSAGAQFIRSQIAQLEQQLARPGPKPEPRNKAVGEIYVGVIPKYSELDMIAPVWLALAAYGALGQPTSSTNLVPGLFQARDGSFNNATEVANLFVNASVTRSHEFPYVPEFIGFSNSYVWLAKWPSIDPAKGLAGDSRNPFLEVAYQAVLKRFGSLTLPSQFTVTKYSPPAKTGDRRVSYIIYGSVSDVRVGVVLPDYLPHFPEVAAVADYRHIGPQLQSSISVLTKPGEWPSVETVRKTKAYERSLATATRQPQAEKPASRRFIILLTIALTGFSFAVWVWRQETNKQTTTEI